MLEGRGVHVGTLERGGGQSSRERLDTELMALFRDTRDRDVFDCLYRNTRGSVFDWLRRLDARGKSQTDPLELLQDTFVNVYRYSRRFRNDSDSSFRVWVRTIAANAMKRALKQAPRARGHDLPVSAEPVDLRPGPARCFQIQEERRALARSWLLFLEHYSRAYDALGPRDREALRLIEVEAVSYAEAARRLEVGSSNMKMIMFRSRQRILRHMRRAMGDEPALQVRAAG
jgi:RNA polymerase sigma factor (sigma-70 family)